MAQRVVVTLSDDIDGGEAAETIAFGLDGKMYEIDLNPANAKKLRKVLAPYLAAGRKITAKQGGRGGRGAKPAGAAARGDYTHTALAPDPAAVRAWAQSNKLEVPARGRIPKRIYEAFQAAS
ncbi:Lsr2 family protein [Streptomyces sp. NPDC048623]|uniref:histone-like nucleoid-structuring protein Lsr2 n=1 Tax=Streptomyces sp. NPDC048623 TaxID=3155761 RepID=UPI0034290874